MDALLAQEAFAPFAGRHTLHTVEDGVEAMAFLRQAGPYADAPRPDLILLDLNLPKHDGHGVLAEVKADASLSVIPVIVLTTSRNARDIRTAYSLHANCYICKPVRFRQFTEIVKAIEHFWCTVVTLP